MLTYKQAYTLAETWVRVCCGDGVQIVSDAVIKKPYGWIFFYQSSAFLASGDYRHALAGNLPILVDRMSYEIRATGRLLEEFLMKYEATLPKARLEVSLPSEP